MPHTLPETNIFAPKNGWLEDEFPIGEAYFQGRTVKLREGNSIDKTGFLAHLCLGGRGVETATSRAFRWGDFKAFFSLENGTRPAPPKINEVSRPPHIKTSMFRGFKPFLWNLHPQKDLDLFCWW